MPRRETADQRAERLLGVGMDLVCRVRDDDPDATGRWLVAMPVDEVRDMAMLLAAIVPDDRSPGELLAWFHRMSPHDGRETSRETGAVHSVPSARELMDERFGALNDLRAERRGRRVS